jgi:hypothetical protein
MSQPRVSRASGKGSSDAGTEAQALSKRPGSAGRADAWAEAFAAGAEEQA